MGQSSIPVLNRSGNSMFWTSVWDNKHNYTMFFKEDILIRKYITLLFNEKISTQNIPSIKTDNYVNTRWVKHYNIKFDINKNSLETFLQRFNKLPLYISKIHILRLNDWVILYFIGSTPTSGNKFDSVNILKSSSNTSFFVKKYTFTKFKSIYNF